MIVVTVKMLTRFRNQLRYLLTGTHIDRALAQEIEFHRDMIARDERRLGRSPEMAMANATRKMGNTTLMTEYSREAWLIAWLDTLVRDVRYALRSFARYPAFTVVALLQSLEVLLFALLVLRVYNAGNVLLIFGLETLLVLVAVNLGIFLSMFARTEFQAVQFIPLVVVPQVLLSGVIFPVTSEPGWLQWISNVLPLTYAAQAMRDVMLKGADLTWPSIQLDAGVVFAFAVGAIVAAVATLRRRIA